MSNRLLVDAGESWRSVAKKVTKLAMPIILSNLLYTVESAFSIILVSGLSATAVAAVGYSASMLWFIYSLMALSYTGTSVLVAQMTGARKDPSPALLWGLVMSFFTALPLTFVGTHLVAFLMERFGASKGVVFLAREYLDPIFAFITVGFITNTIYAAYNGYGDTKTPFKVALIMNLVNISSAYLLIYGNLGFPRLETRGAGWGIALSEVVGLLAYAYLYLRKKKPFPISMCFSRDVLAKMLRIGTPTALERAFSSLSFNIFVGFLASFGDKVLAAHQIGLRVESASFMIGFGFMVAATTLSGQNWGAKNYAGLHHGIRITAHLTAFVMGLMGVFLLVFPYYFSLIFTRDTQVIEYAVYYLVIVALSQPQMAYASIYSGALKGMGKTHIPLAVNLTSFWVFRIIPSYLLLKYFHTPLIPWIFMSVEMTLRAIIFYWAYRRQITRFLSAKVEEERYIKAPPEEVKK
ncbi:MATE efflux family protein [Hydrogenobacter thermophilus TK-6]|uniref:Multidrug-efflux transporter n=1 Tax=Hydrogenobacter thermophilus (strain DSM 6534 / IAM 12695 / TK-6) TaxID=608538 RepID=D3DK46_HYDTT|nr:MATE family efflux transporter [Hydrogenobacter thermophilus]ADO46117.1 MATE efflux family protein [Hydrogenobacter thermophilus TK-6]BAI70198.1 Na-driven multidrug efflux protein [Hydrogenobacter thermophilus TK-6]